MDESSVAGLTPILRTHPKCRGDSLARLYISRSWVSSLGDEVSDSWRRSPGLATGQDEISPQPQTGPSISLNVL